MSNSVSAQQGSGLIHEYLQRTPGSRALAERARAVLPDGVSTDTRLFHPYGIYIERGLGARKWDVDGNEYLDFFGGHGALMLGHCHPRVVAAVTESFQKGIQFAANHPGEVAWAEEIKKHFRNADKVRFAGSGTEATLLALRMARAFTGRKKIVRVMSHYHGWHDFAVSGYNSRFDGSPAPGVLPEIAANTILVRPEDINGLRDLLAANKNDVAALLIEPVGSHFGITPTSDDFVREAFAEAHKVGALVILDEVISAFRVGLGGMQEYLGVKPDLTCMAKVTAGGTPGGAVIGTEEVMAVLSVTGADGKPNAKKVFHQGTFTGNPVAASAALATIREIAEKNLCAHATQLGELVRASLNELFARRQMGWLAYGRFSGFHILPRQGTRPPDPQTLTFEDYLERPVDVLGKLRIALNLEGVDIASRGTAFVSGIHTEADVKGLVAGFERALDRLARE